MATTKIRPIKSTVKKAIDYIVNEKKTDGKLLVSGIDCSPEIAYIEFNMAKDFYGKSDKNLAFHITQSFKPGEVDYNTAHEIGVKFANELFKGNYQAVVSTHIDKNHIHNHIIFNSVSFTTGKKYYDNKKTYAQMRSISDKLCTEYGLSVVQRPKQKAKQYREWLEVKAGTSWKEIIRNDIDTAIRNSNSYEAFINKMKAMDYSIKQGKFTSFKPRVKDRYVRGKSLGSDYTDDAIRARITMKEMGYSITTYSKATRYYKANNNTYNKFNKFKRRRSLLEINMMLILSIMREMANRKQQRMNTSKNQNRYTRVDDSRVQLLAQQLVLIRNENISSRFRLDSLRNETNKQIELTRSTMKQLDPITKKLEDINRAIISYQINKPKVDEVTSSVFKKRLQNRYEIELKTFEFAKQKLAAAGINSEGDIEKFVIRYQDHKQKISELIVNLEKLKSKSGKYDKLYDTIEKLHDNKFMDEINNEKNRYKSKIDNNQKNGGR